MWGTSLVAVSIDHADGPVAALAWGPGDRTRAEAAVLLTPCLPSARRI